MHITNRLYGLYTMEVILATAFGHRADVINGEADELAEASSSIFTFFKARVSLITIMCK